MNQIFDNNVLPIRDVSMPNIELRDFHSIIQVIK